MVKISRFKEEQFNTKENIDFLTKIDEYFSSSIGTNVEKLQNFSKFVPRQDITNFIAKYEIFKKILPIPGSIIECGILFGGGLMTFAQLSAIFEPVNFERKIIGFDSFTGLTKISEIDKKSISKFAKKGGYGLDSYDDLKKCTELYDENRFLNHIPKIEIIKGDATKTIPKYIEKNPSTVVSLLYLDFLAYEPTKIALKYFVPRMPKGSIIALNILNDKHWPGTTKALLESLNINELKFRRFSFTPYTQYTVI
jgi:hypothetical protein